MGPVARSSLIKIGVLMCLRKMKLFQTSAWPELVTGGQCGPDDWLLNARVHHLSAGGRRPRGFFAFPDVVLILLGV